MLEELNFSFNLVEQQKGLIACAANFPNLRVLIVTGNPFAISGEEQNYEVLQTLMLAKKFPEGMSGILINESLAGG